MGWRMQKRRNIRGILVSTIFLAGYLSSNISKATGDRPGTPAKSGSASAGSPKVKILGRLRATTRGTSSPGPQHARAGREPLKVRSGGAHSGADEVPLLREQLALQQKQIEQLRLELDQQKKFLEQAVEHAQAGRSFQAPSVEPPNLGQAASLEPAIPTVPGGAGDTAQASPLPVMTAPAAPLASPVTQAEVQQYAAKVDDLGKKMEAAFKNLGGFRFSGDFRLRMDVQARSSNTIAGPLQNIRSLYRLRLNVDKELDPRVRFHMQFSTGPLNNGLSNDAELAGTVAKHPFFIAEAYADFHPSSNFSLRGGRMEEIFADNTRFLWDDDVRFNGFHQVVKLPFQAKAFGIKSVELRAAEYILSNPNVPVLSSTSPFVSAGFQSGQKVRDANLFHPGFVLKGDLATNWSHQFISDIQIYRNPNQLQLSSTASGFPVTVSNALGIALSGPMTGTGNATTSPGGALYSAPHFQIVRVTYRLEHTGWTFRGREMPAWLDFQAARNTGTSRLRDAFMVSANAGTVKGFGDVRFLYQFAIKDANSLMSQFTDNDLGTGTGVNIAVHAVRFDLGLTRFLQWHNLLFIQNERRPSNPAERLFVPLQRGANTTFRYLGQLAFTF